MEMFFAFKAEVIKDEERKKAFGDVNAQLKNIYEKLSKLDQSRRSLKSE